MEVKDISLSRDNEIRTSHFTISRAFDLITKFIQREKQRGAFS